MDNKKEIPKETQDLINDSKFLYSRSKYIFDFAIETWYEKLKDFTAKTEFIPLNIEEVREIYKLIESKDKTLSKTIETLIQKIDDVLQKVFKGIAFVKLSTRSPKDSFVNFNSKLEKLLLEELEKSDGSPNEDTIAFSKANRRCLVFQSGKEVIDVFLNSSRIREDLMKALEFPEAFDLSIIIREWKQMDPSLEFRAMVKNKKLNALTQYCYLQYFKNLPQRKEEIQKKILDTFQQFKDLVPQENYIIDFVLVEDHVEIIELNPYFNDTSACLFHWNDQKDRKIMSEGPFEFRILEKEIDHPLDCVPSIWKDYIIEKRKSFCKIQ